MKRIYLAVLAAFALLLPAQALAHCPLCTAGAGALAVLAAYLGVSTFTVGVLIGAFALALSLWIAGMPKKEYFRYQRPILAIVIFLGTVLPIMPLVQDYAPLYVSLWGKYGNLLNRTYAVNLYLAGVPLGMLVLWLSPSISRMLTRVRGRQLPYQGLGITFLLLIVIGVIVQLL